MAEFIVPLRRTDTVLYRGRLSVQADDPIDAAKRAMAWCRNNPEEADALLYESDSSEGDILAGPGDLAVNLGG